jgi:hypothetical protein
MTAIWIRSLRVAGVVAALLVVSSAPAPAAEGPLGKKLDAFASAYSKKHVSAAKTASSAGMHVSAQNEYEKVLVLDPDNKTARSYLGYRKVKGEWEKSDRWESRPDDPKSDKHAEKVREAVAELMKEAIDELTPIAVFARDDQPIDVALERERLREYLTMYDPAGDLVKELAGQRKVANRWLDKKVAESLKSFDGGKATTPRLWLSKTLKGCAARESSLMYVEGDFTQDELELFCQLGGYMFSVFFEVFPEAEVTKDKSQFQFAITSDRAAYESAVDVAPIQIESRRAQFKKASGLFLYTRQALSHMGGQFKITAEDTIVHDMAHMLFDPFVNYRADAWLYVGIAFWFTDRLLGTHRWYCGGFEETAAPGAGGLAGKMAKWRETDAWRPMLKANLETGLLPKTSHVFNASINGLDAVESAKAFSFVDYFLGDRRGEMTKFLKCVRESTPQKGNLTCLTEATGCDEWQWDKAWKDWVKTTY